LCDRFSWYCIGKKGFVAMPILKNAKKALRTSKRKALMNAQTKQQMRTSIKSAKLDASSDRVSLAFSRIDRAVKRGIIHKNKAARLKSQVSRLLVVGSSTSTETKLPSIKSKNSTSVKTKTNSTTSKKNVATKSAAQ